MSHSNLGYDVRAIIGRPVTLFVPAYWRALVTACFEEALRKRRMVAFSLPTACATGGWAICDFRAVPLIEKRRAEELLVSVVPRRLENNNPAGGFTLDAEQTVKAPDVLQRIERLLGRCDVYHLEALQGLLRGRDGRRSDN